MKGIGIVGEEFLHLLVSNQQLVGVSTLAAIALLARRWI